MFLKLKKGFTLVEVIIASAITVILIAAVMALFGPTKALISDIDKNVETNAISDTLSGYVFDNMSRASDYQIYVFKNSQLNAQTSVVQAYITAADPKETVYSMVISNSSVNASGTVVFGDYRIFDFGKLTAGTQFTDRIATKNNFRVFNDEFYRNANYRFSYETTIDNSLVGSGIVTVWCRMGIEPYDADGNLIAEERTNMFKLLNINTSGTLAYSDDKLKDYSYDEDTQIVILYKIKKYGV